MKKPTLDEFMKDTPPEERSCDSCNSANDAKLQVYRRIKNSKEEFKVLCEICANTNLGVWSEFTENYQGENTLAIMEMIARVGNMILKEIRLKK